MVRAAGIEPARVISPTDFRTTSAFAAVPRDVCGLDYPFTVAFAVGAARLVSTPSRFRAWLGIAISGFPEFEQFCTPSFQEGTQLFKSVASTNFATPAHFIKLYQSANRLPRQNC